MGLVCRDTVHRERRPHCCALPRVRRSAMLAAPLQTKHLRSGERRCTCLRSCASCSAMGTTARRLSASGRSHNLSVKRTSSGWLRQPAASAYLRRYAADR